ncbi:reverse transcriptase domain-containing protein [Tanacetum coccineum]
MTGFFAHMGDDVDISTLTMEQHLALIQDNNKPSIVKPKIDGDVKFEINGNFMRELRRKLFKGIDDEDAHEHTLGACLEMENRLFAGLVTTWDFLEKVFMRRYFSPFKSAIKLEKFRNFNQEMDETLYHAWERYNDLLFRCPQHDLNNHQEVQIFYTRLDIPTRIRLDSKGFIPLMSPAQALKLIQVMTNHSHNWYNEATTRESINDNSDNVDTKKLKENIHAIQPMPFPGCSKGNLYKIREAVCKIGIPRMTHKLKTQMDNGHAITVKDVERLREDEQDNDIPLQDSVMQPLTPQTAHIKPPDNVASATSPILDKHLNEFEEEFSDITRDTKKAYGNPVNNIKELLDIITTYDFETFIRKLLHQACSLETLTRLHSSTWATKWFKRLVAYAKCNHDSYEREMRLLGRRLTRIHPLPPSFEI